MECKNQETEQNKEESVESKIDFMPQKTSVKCEIRHEKLSNLFQQIKKAICHIKHMHLHAHKIVYAFIF